MSAGTQILAIGGGKGGVGKSFAASGLATAIANAGHPTIIIDLDLGGANLHTLFGINDTDKGIGDFIYGTGSANLAEYAVTTGIMNLRLISGNGFIPGIANLTYQQKVKVLKAISKLNVEYVILDLGAGTSYNVIDFFSITQSGILVTVSEPTAILNAYEFLKNVIFRLLTQQFKGNAAVLKTLDEFRVCSGGGEESAMQSLISAVRAVDEQAAVQIQDLCKDFHPGLILNMSRGTADQLGKNLVEICKSFLNINVVYLGAVPFDEVIHECLQQMKSATLEFPESAPNLAIQSIAKKCMLGHWMNRKHVDELDVGEDEEDGVGTPDGKPRISDALAGHGDADLSSLLAGFLAEYASAEKPPREVPVPRREGDESPAATQAPALSQPTDWLCLTPRIDATIQVPRFARPDEASHARRPSFFARLLGRGRDMAEFEKRILAIPDADHIALALEETGKNTPREEALGWAWMQTGLKLVDYHQLFNAQHAFAYAHACLAHNADVANNLGAALLAAGRAQPARQILLAGFGLSHNDIRIRFNLGLGHLTLGEYKAALQCFKKVRALHDKGIASLFLCAYCHLMEGEYREAEGLFHSVISNDATDLAARFNLGICELHRQLFPEAVETFSSILIISPDDTQALAARGLAHWQAGHTDAALQDMSDAVAKQPAELSYRATHGNMALLAGRLDKAYADIQTISDLIPGNQRYQVLLSEIRNRIGHQAHAAG
ncbi:MAG: tetratricopeptide repeat protein [Spartobacteria bacterium]|nr:tetratricopeptide repeat protein [Spartobacteria bacterium]